VVSLHLEVAFHPYLMLVTRQPPSHVQRLLVEGIEQRLLRYMLQIYFKTTSFEKKCIQIIEIQLFFFIFPFVSHHWLEMFWK
jgi:hypothetical protein